MASVVLTSLLVYVPNVPREVAYMCTAAMLAIVCGVVLRNWQSHLDFLRLVRRSGAYWLLASILLISALGHAVMGSFSSMDGALNAVGYPIFLFMIYFIIAPASMRELKNVCSSVACVLAVFSVVGIAASLLEYRPMLHTRIPVIGLYATKSVFHNPNYFSVIAFVGLLTAAYCAQFAGRRAAKNAWLAVALLHLCAVILAHSRGTYAALVGALGIWVMTAGGRSSRLTIPMRLGILVLVFVLALAAMGSSDVFSFLQSHKGLNLRDQLWSNATAAIAAKPVFGWGFELEALHAALGIEKSVQNTFLNFALMTGLGGGLALIWFMLYPIGRLLLLKGRGLASRRRFLLIAMVSFLILSQFRIHTPGGLGFASLSLAVVLGQANSLAVVAGLAGEVSQSRCHGRL